MEIGIIVVLAVFMVIIVNLFIALSLKCKKYRKEADKAWSILDSYGAINPQIKLRKYCQGLFDHINASDLKLEDRFKLADKMYKYITTGKTE